MTEQNNPQMAPPLDTDLGSVDTSMPLVENGVYELRVDKVEIKETSRKDGRFISLDMVTTAPSKGRKGEDLGPGVHIFDNVMCNPTGKGTWDMVKRNLGALVQAGAVQGATIGNIDSWVPQLTGRVLKVRVGYEPAGVDRNGKAFREKNTAELYIKA